MQKKLTTRFNKTLPISQILDFSIFQFLNFSVVIFSPEVIKKKWKQREKQRKWNCVVEGNSNEATIVYVLNSEYW